MATVCCPDNYIFVDEGGAFVDPDTGLENYITNTNVTTPTFAEVINHCCLLDKTIVLSTGDNIPCPCCPDGYDYDPILDNCFDIRGNRLSTIPCLDCDCTPPPLFECAPCESNALPGSFSFDFTQKFCDEGCNPHNDKIPECGEAAFLASVYYDPSIVFKLKNKNLL